MPHYAAWSAVRGVVLATVVAGTLDLLSAFAFAAADGASPLGVLAGVGGAVVDRAKVSDACVLAGVGLALHFGIMAAMATVYVASAALIGWINRVWVLSGVVYGLTLWVMMDRVVLPWRWPTLFPLSTTVDIAEQMFDHVVLVGLPIAWIAQRAAYWRPALNK